MGQYRPRMGALQELWKETGLGNFRKTPVTIRPIDLAMGSLPNPGAVISHFRIVEKRSGGHGGHLQGRGLEPAAARCPQVSGDTVAGVAGTAAKRGRSG